MSDDSSENGPIGLGLGVSLKLKNVEVQRGKKAFGAAAVAGAGPKKKAPMAAAAPGEEVAAARNATLAPVRVRAATVAKAPAKKAAAPVVALGEAAAVAVAEEAGGAAVVVPKVAAAAALDAGGAGDVASAEEAAAAAAEVADLKRRMKAASAAVRVTRPPPADAPELPVAEFADPASKLRTKTYLWTDPAEAFPTRTEAGGRVVPSGLYAPVSTPKFRDFIVQVYQQYSQHLERVIRLGAAAAAEPKELDKDACRRRDPNKVENFYYQKFVRDYLSRGTPYRGLLVYHGLGSGKTCTSIAAAEALYWGPKKTIWVLTPATLSNNYRRELGKCGYFPLRQRNNWSFMKIAAENPTKADSLAFTWVTDGVLGLPPDTVRRQGGAWIADPDKASNWDDLSAEARESIREQQREHLNYRFKFIHYNGVTPAIMAQLAADSVAKGRSVFDDSVIIVDEIHNLVRTINGTMIGGKPVSQIISQVEPREFNWSTPLGRQRPGFKYPRGYTLYRMIMNAVGAKVIALSATPMINYAQEMAVLMNLIGGEYRMSEISLRGMARDPATLRRLEAWAAERPDIDFFAVEEAADKSTVLNVTPVPFGFSKVVGDDYTTRGFVKLPPLRTGTIEKSKERNMDTWSVELLKDLEAKGILGGGGAAEAEAAVAAARAAGPGTPIATAAFKLHVFPVLPEDAKEFVANFVDRNTLKITNTNVLKARTSGLISYYKGGGDELMPRTTRNEIVEVPMSEYMFKEYSRARMAELEMESPAAGPEEGEEAGAAGKKKRKGMTAAEMDLYTQATKSQQTGFLALSRAACNWVFPEDVPRPDVSVKQQTKLLGLDQDRVIAADLAEDVEPDLEVAPAGGAAAGGSAAAAGGEEGGAEATDAVLPDAPVAAPAVTALDATLAGILGTLMSGLEAKGEEYLNKGLEQFSPKYAAILANIRASPGPVLVYSQFKTLEGLGIFAAALRAADEKFLPLDIQKNGAGDWEIPEALMAEAARPRYILYTGDQELEKRRLLLQLYNADVAGLPPRLSAQCAELLAGAPDNRDGRICKVFMITQSGAEGISLFNTRQVHIMEPYWNNVRLQQVIGRAIRLCSHMFLDWDDRTVDVFTYLSVFTAEQKATGSKALMMADKAMTTDQIIFDIATKKQMLADGLFEVAQSSAVDCELHFHEHGEAIQCFRFAAAGGPMFMFHPDWHKDLQASVRAAGGEA